MRKAVGKWFYMVMMALCIFTLGFFTGQNTAEHPSQVTVIQTAQSEREGSAGETEILEHVQNVSEQIDAEPLLIDLNTADESTLDMLPGIGPAYAQRIIEYRQTNGPFKTVEEIMNVSGIGEKTFEKMKDLITVEDEP